VLGIGDASSGMSARSLYIGIMSGTSLDGVDAVLADFSASAPRILATRYEPYPDELRTALLALHLPGDNELHRAALLANAVTERYAACTLSLLAAIPGATVPTGTIQAIGCHGQTIRHQPQSGYTVQLVNGALLAECTGITSVVDFRSRDIAAGGEGAPLVPAFHAVCFRNAKAARAIVNIGGIANVTRLPSNGPVAGFDTGPGNLLMDAWAMRHLGESYDRDGGFAAQGSVNQALLSAMLGHPYFARVPPKSTGRDEFNLAWLESFNVSEMPPRDVQATLAELTALTIAQGIEQHCPGTTEVFVCGGGVHNRHLMQKLGSHLGSRKLASTAELGVDPDWVEALAFAWLAERAIDNLPGNAPEVTGAKGLRVLGAIYPA